MTKKSENEVHSTGPKNPFSRIPTEMLDEILFNVVQEDLSDSKLSDVGKNLEKVSLVDRFLYRFLNYSASPTAGLNRNERISSLEEHHRRGSDDAFAARFRNYASFAPFLTNEKNYRMLDMAIRQSSLHCRADRLNDLADHLKYFDEHQHTLMVTYAVTVLVGGDQSAQQKACDLIARMRRDGHLSSAMNQWVESLDERIPNLMEMRRQAERRLQMQSDIERHNKGRALSDSQKNLATIPYEPPNTDARSAVCLTSASSKRKFAGDDNGPRKALRAAGRSSPTIPEASVSVAEGGSVSAQERESVVSVAAAGHSKGSRMIERHDAGPNLDERPRSRGNSRGS